MRLTRSLRSPAIDRRALKFFDYGNSSRGMITHETRPGFLHFSPVATRRSRPAPVLPAARPKNPSIRSGLKSELHPLSASNCTSRIRKPVSHISASASVENYTLCRREHFRGQQLRRTRKPARNALD